MASERCRNWFIRLTKTNNTKQGLYEYDFNDVYKTLCDKYDKVIMALHDKDIDNIHCHIILQNQNQITFKTLKNLLPYGDIEQQRGSNEECYKYIQHIDEKSKETEKDVYDESCIQTNIEDIQGWLKIKQGQRTDLLDFKNAVLSGATYEDLLGYCVNDDTLVKFNSAQIVAHILWALDW